MIRTALLVEIEELLFDTGRLRADALHDALASEGVAASLDVVRHAHAGVTARMALGHIAAAASLDDVGTDLVLRRAADAVTDRLTRDAPPFDPAIRDHLDALASEFPIGVVTRATRETAQWLLERAGLDAAVSVVRSLSDLQAAEHAAVWRDAVKRLHAERGVAFARAALLQGARDSGVVAVPVGNAPEPGTSTQLVSLVEVNTSFVASLF